MEILDQLGINQGFFWILGLYLGTFILVYFLGLKDLTTAVVERNKRIHGRAEQATHLKDELRGIHEKLALEMKRVRQEANETFLSLRNKAATEQKGILGAAREKAAAEIKATRTDVTARTELELKKLEGEVPALAKLILDQIMNGAGAKKKSLSAELRG